MSGEISGHASAGVTYQPGGNEEREKRAARSRRKAR
jgi:hypothetical protein